jgi:Neuraminidase (sialidase)
MKKLFLVLVMLVAISVNAQWEPDVRLTNAPGYSMLDHNNIASSGDTVHVVWTDTRDGNYEIYYKRSTDGGSNWSTDFRLTNNTANSQYASIAVSGKYVHIVYEDSRTGNAKIYYRRSTNGGASWEPDRQLTNDTNVSIFPSIAASGQILHVVWYDNRDGNFEIYYKRSATGGTSWTADTRLTYNISESSYPSISISGSIVVVVWLDLRDGGLWRYTLNAHLMKVSVGMQIYV